MATIIAGELEFKRKMGTRTKRRSKRGLVVSIAREVMNLGLFDRWPPGSIVRRDTTR
jgi:hypothetical protein